MKNIITFILVILITGLQAQEWDLKKETKEAKVSDFKTEATKRTSIDDLIDEYNAVPSIFRKLGGLHQMKVRSKKVC